MIIKTNSSLETTLLGENFGKLLYRSVPVYLDGEMASGKTQFTKGIAKAFGLMEHFSSPTYTIINKYENETNILYHMDAYRIEDITELDYIGFYDIYKKDTIIIEWAQIIKDELDNIGIYIKIEKDKDDFNKRTFYFEGYDEKSKDILNKLEKQYE